MRMNSDGIKFFRRFVQLKSDIFRYCIIFPGKLLLLSSHDYIFSYHLNRRLIRYAGKYCGNYLVEMNINTLKLATVVKNVEL